MTGSHNMSMAAWGKLQKNGRELFIRSFGTGLLQRRCRHLRFSQAGQGSLSKW
jgi:hypothetical protein